MSNRNKLPGVFYPEHLVKIMDVIDRPKVGVAVALAFFCGLRINEVCSLRIEDVDLSSKKLKVVDSKYTLRKKTGYGKDRYVTLPDQMINPLRKWVSIIEGGKWLFPSDKSPDAHLRKKSLYEQFHFYLKRADLCIPERQITYTQRVNGKKFERTISRHKYYFHTLRHSYGVYLRNKGVSLDTIKNAMGHERYDTTLVYARIGTVEMDREINQAFGNALRSQVIPQERVSQALALPNNSKSPLEFLQMQLVEGKISDVDYQKKLALLQQANVKMIQ
ncbi:MAG TPA: tyrosine-type recombinase/integrase [Acidobacteriota bacterium]|nr:tyrosine-type recombinase/integrase [Acidobacteriota bacterium]